LPWETTDQYIRSGHRAPEEFQPDSLRTIVLSVDEGIKAVVGKPKSKGTMEVQSYLFDLSKGWTLDRAKAWFEKHQKNDVVREHFLALLPFKVLEKIVDKPLRIRGIAMTAGMSRNFNIYTPEELQSFASKLVSAPVYVEHVAVPNAVGRIVKTKWDGQNLWYEAEIHDEEAAEKIRKGLIRHVSIGADYETIDVLDGKIPHGLHNAELSLVAVPGIPETNIQIMEKMQAKEQAFEPIIAGEYILGFTQDASAFLPEHFTTVWLDRENGVLAIVGKLRAEPETQRVQSIFFAKEKMWDENKIRDWLLLHPHYMAPAGASAHLQTPLKERENMKERIPLLKPLITERVWTTRYVNDLPDSSFALILPGGERDEQGKTKPRSLRMFPYKDAQGRVDLPHLRNGNARLSQAKIPEEQREKALRKLVAVKKKLGIGAAAEEMKLYEQVNADEEIPEKIEALPEPTSDEFLASLEDILDQIWEAIENLQQQIRKGQSVTESLLKKPNQPVIAVDEAISLINSIMPSPMVERSWSLGPQRLCQELRGIILKLRESVKDDGK